MTRNKGNSHKDKVSSEFRARLNQLKPQQKVYAIVLLYAPIDGPSHCRPSRAERQAAIAAIRESARQALTEIDAILERHKGKRLSDVNALGSILIETNVAGINALAASERVKAILENQPVWLLH